MDTNFSLSIRENKTIKINPIAILNAPIKKKKISIHPKGRISKKEQLRYIIPMIQIINTEGIITSLI